MSLIALVAVILWGAWVSLDERTWGSWALHQPLVAGTVAGWLLGDVRSGLAAGFLFQALWPGLLPIGGALLPASGLGALAATVVCVLGPARGEPLGPWPGHPLLLPAAVLGVGAAWAGQIWEQGIRRRNSGREEAALASGPGWPGRLGRAFRASVLDGALRGAVPAAAVLGAAWWARQAGVLDALARNPWVSLTGEVLPLAGLGFCLGLAVRWLGSGRTRRRPGRQESGDQDRRPGGWLAPFFLLFGLEALYNARGQQRGGMLRAVRGSAPDLPSDHPVLRELAQGPLNTNPVLAGYLAGILIRLVRREDPQDQGGAAAAVERCRDLLGPVIAGAGDRLLWGRVRPALSLTALFSGLFWTVEPAILYWLGYNATQVYWRRRALRTGLRGETAVRRELRGRGLDAWSLVWGRWARLVTGVLIVIVLSEGWRGLGPAGAGLAAAAGLVGWSASSGKRIGVLGAAVLVQLLAMVYGVLLWITARGVE